MNREANYTIKGFIYQFNKTLEQLLSKPEGTEITIEGIIEDIDVVSSEITHAIQCKYHETKENYRLSDIAKPVLQMMVHYSKNIDRNIQYILYAHFKNEKFGEKVIAREDIETILKTSDKNYIANYISHLKPTKDISILEVISKKRKTASELKKISDFYNSATDLTLSINLDDFIKPEKFKFIIGKSFNELSEETKRLLNENGNFSKEDVEDLFYPNAIQLIADKSIKHSAEERRIEKKGFISQLEKTKKTAISRWTKELSSYRELLKKRRNQLKTNLQKNNRLRYFLFKIENIENFENEIVNFITDYLGKYHYKIKLHSQTPIFCVVTNKTNLISDIESRLYLKGIITENGYKGQKYFQDAFLREPKRIIKGNWFEFKLRLCNLNEDTQNAMNRKKCEDMFMIGRLNENQLDSQDINEEYLDISSLNELRYLLLLKDNID